MKNGSVQKNPSQQGDLRRDDLWTVAAIAACAFVLTDIAHECLGHGGAYLLLGGRSVIFTTTQLIASGPGVDPNRIFAGNPHRVLFARIYSIAGPVASFLLACIALFLLQQRVFKNIRARLFLWLAATFSLFWAIGYMIWSGVTGVGDWEELIRGVGFEWELRVVLVVLGLLLYRATARRLRGSPLKIVFAGMSADWYQRLRRVLWVACLSAACIASLGAFFDPRGPIRILHDALPETLIANLGVFLAPIRLRREGYEPLLGLARIERSIGWISAAIVVAVFYALILGPGLKMRI